MNVLSLFNGMGFGRMSLDTLGIKVDKYYSSEIDKFANQAANALFPDTIQIGDVTKWKDWDIDLGDIDLLIAGFPCQAWSMAGKQEGDNDPRGALVHDLIDIWKSINRSREAYGKAPVKFMFENVKMKRNFLDYINNLFDVEPICINSALVSAQNRERYYWTNIGDIEQPEDKGIMLSDIIEHGVCESTIMSDKFAERQKDRKCLVINPKDKAANLSANEYVKNGRNGDYIQCNDNGEQVVFVDRDKSYSVTASYQNGVDPKQYFEQHRKQLVFLKGRGNNPGGLRGQNGKAPCMTSNSYECNVFAVVESGARKSRGDEIRSDGKSNCLLAGGHQSRWLTKEQTFYRKLTVTECARLQTVPGHHILKLLNCGVSNSQLYKMLGNGWTHSVITHIFKGLLIDSAPITKRRMFSQMQLC